MRTRHALAAILALSLFAACGPAELEGEDDALAQEVDLLTVLSGAYQFDHINIERKARGIATLTRGSCLDDVALKHSKAMASKGTIFHTSNLAAAASACGAWSKVGENVGMGGSSESIFKAFMNSPDHKANILDRAYNRVGVGVVVENGTQYVTQFFIKR